MIRSDGWGWFAVWTATGASLTFSVLGAASVGLLVFPFALALLFWVAYARRWREAPGLVEGIGLMLMLVAYLNRDYAPCPPNGLSLPATPRRASVSCGGLDPQPWLIAGALVSGGALLVYAVLRRRAAL